MKGTNVPYIVICLTIGLLLQANEVSKVSSSMRVQYGKALRIYQQLLPEIQVTELFEEQIPQTAFMEMQANVSALEGQIIIRPSHQGKSRNWSSRSRTYYVNGKAYEPRGDVANYYLGENSEVIAFNGEFTQNTLDMKFPTRGGIGFVLRRFYYSNLSYSGPIGNGWDFNYNSRLVIDADSPENAQHISLFINGRKIDFTQKTNQWEVSSGNFYSLKIKDNIIQIQDKDLNLMEFEPSKESFQGWRLKYLASRHDNFSANRVSLFYQKRQ